MRRGSAMLATRLDMPEFWVQDMGLDIGNFVTRTITLMRTTCTLAVNTLSANIERSAWQ